MRPHAAALLLALLQLLPAGAMADDLQGCLEYGSEYRQTIAVCSRVIAAKRASKRDLSKAYLQRAHALRMTGNKPDGARDVDEAVNTDPTNPDAYRDRAYVAYLESRYPQAVADYSTAIRLAPDNPALWTGRAETYTWMNEVDRAIDDYTRAIELDTSRARWQALWHSRRGRLFEKKGELQKALADYRLAIEGKTADKDTEGDLRRVEAALGGQQPVASSKADSSKSSAGPPAPAPSGRAAKTASRRTAEALPSRAESPAASPEKAYEVCSASGGDPDAKVKACTDVLARGNDAPAKLRVDAFYRRGYVYHIEKNDDERALADYDAALRLDPRNADAYFYRALIHRSREDPDRALADLTEAVRLDPSYPHLSARAGIYVRKGELDRAIADLDAAIRAEPNSTLLFTERGDVWLQKGDPERALADYEAALRADPTYGNAKNGRVKARAALAAGQKPKPPASREAETATAALPAAPREVATAPAAPVLAPAPVAPAPKAAIVPAIPEIRIALVIGNSAYSAVSPLPNPARDAQAVAQALRNVGFRTVTLESNVTRERMMRALQSFAAQAVTADWAVIYYAGHGIEVGGANYLIPVDAALKADRDVQFEAVPLEQVLAAIEGAKKLRLVLLDACRDNPFVRQMTRTLASRSVGRGLAPPPEPDGGTLVAFAAKHGQVALDGDGRNSPFVSALVKHLETPGVEINKLFRLVRNDVMAATGRLQEPFVYGSLPPDDFFFKPAPAN